MSERPAVASRPGFLDSFFKITDRGSTVPREIRGGLVTFFTMAYIVVLNPLIIGTVKDSSGQYVGGGTDPTASIAKVAVATALIAGVLTILMGLVANFPLALATGLGLNAFLAYSVASKMTWADAMGLVVLEGIIILILVLTGFRRAVFEAVPRQLKVAISVGIGLFIAFIGVIDAGFVRRPAAPTGPPVELGVGGSLRGWPVLIFVVGLVLIVTLYARKVKGAILIGILVATVLAIVVEAITDVGARTPDNPGGWGLSVPSLPDSWFSRPDLDLLGEFSLFGSFAQIGAVSAILLIFTLMLADFFDTMGTMTAIGAEANLLDADGNPPNAQRILIVDSVAAAAGGAGSVSSNTSYIESASGVGEGARTGLASVVTGICFLISMVVAPLVTLVPYEAATPALVLVGFLMMTQVKGIDFDDLEVAIPAFLTIILMPFTYSISAGIGAGFVSYTLLKVVRGKAREVHPLMWIVSALFVVYFAIGPLGDWLT
ncbi:NCS2 family permease [Kribbella italica]|uniref:AGZA family xanthine/uracil permease-like MFS transporter n=1 Tax=Kribbella italica TaxID=1540520 RepID=A0A7W9MWC8_9ACTN|nr:NCS2 family permease [Kribbella italica]MBB5837933.1 AGZA family xanthine/uracil permease-like MFS transporter [Kribbella italica]